MWECAKVDTSSDGRVLGPTPRTDGVAVNLMAEGQDSLLSTVDALLRNGRVVAFTHSKSAVSGWRRDFDRISGAYVHIVQTGACQLDLCDERRNYQLETGDVVLLPQGSRHQLTFMDHAHSEAASSFGPGSPEVFTATYVLSHESPLSMLLPLFIRMRADSTRSGARIHGLVNLLLDSMLEQGQQFVAVASRLAEAILLAGIAGDVVVRQPCSTISGNCLDIRIARAVASMTSDHQNPWTIESLAGDCHMSRSAFAAGFKKAVGKTPKAFLTALRMEDARALLTTTNLTLAEIAEKVGYASEFSFSHAFKKTTGMAPGCYRHRRRR